MMAAATRLLASSDGCIASLNYDALTMFASGVTVDNTNGIERIAFSIGINEQLLSTVADIGQTSAITFPLLMAVTMSLNGITKLVIAGYDFHGIGSV